MTTINKQFIEKTSSHGYGEKIARLAPQKPTIISAPKSASTPPLKTQTGSITKGARASSTPPPKR